jgi:LuxR family maltose regulon positive regulatory protein
LYLGLGDQVEKKLRVVTQLLDNPQSAQISPGEANRIRWEVSAILTVMDNKRHPTRENISHIQALIQAAPKEDTYFSGFLGNSLAIAFDENDDLDAAIAAFYQSCEFARVHELNNAFVHSQCDIARMNKKKGHLAEAEQAYQIALQYMIPNETVLGSRILALSGLLEIAFERNDAEQTRHLERDIFGQFNHIEGALAPFNYQILVLLRLANYSLAQGDFQIGNYYFQRAAQDMQQNNELSGHDLLEKFISAQVRIWIALGEYQQGEQWLKTQIRLAPDDRKPSTAESIGLARIYLAQNKPEQALCVLKPLVPVAHQKGMREQEIEINLLQAIAYGGVDEKEQAYQEIRQAVALAEPEGYVRIFTREGEAMKKLILSYLSDLKEKPGKAKQTQEAQYLLRLSRAFAMNDQNTIAVSAEVKNIIAAGSTLLEPLSQRESEVLTMLLVGKSAKEIAAALAITPNTTRAHIQSIHRKLNVHSRLGVYQRAKELNLIG